MACCHPGWTSVSYIFLGIVRDDTKEIKAKYEEDKRW